MSDPVDIGAKRWDRAEFSHQVSPRDVLVGVLADIDAGRVSPDHLIVLMRCGSGPSGRVEYAHGGSADRVTQLGMLTRATWQFQE